MVIPDQSNKNRVALVTGSNKGIGFEVVRQLCLKNPSWIVYLTSRDVGRGEAAVRVLKNSGLNPRFHQLDILSKDSIKTCAEFLRKEHGGLDVLVNNAGIAYKVASTASFSEQAVVTMATNYYGTLSVCEEFFPLLRDHARVVTVSSICGNNNFAKLSPELQSAFKKCITVEEVSKLVETFLDVARQGKHLEAGWPPSAYGTTKLALTTATFIQQHMLDADEARKDIIINACCPGYVSTDMSSHKGTKTPEEGADTLVYLAMLPENCENPRGHFVNNRTINDMF